MEIALRSRRYYVIRCPIGEWPHRTFLRLGPNGETRLQEKAPLGRGLELGILSHIQQR